MVAALVAATAFYGVGDFALRGHPVAVHWWANVGWTLIALVSGLLCFYTAGAIDDPRQRQSWHAFGTGALGWFVGMLIWDYYELSLGDATPFPTVAEIGFLGLAPAYVVGFWRYGAGAPSRHFSRKQVGQFGLVLTTAITVGVIIYGAPDQIADVTLAYLVVALGYPVLHLSALVFAFLVVVQRDWGARRPVLLLLLLSLAMLTAVTTLYGFSLLTQSYEAGHNLDVMWVASFSLLIWASFEERWRANDTAFAIEAPLGSHVFEDMLPGLSVAAILFTLWAYQSHFSASLMPALLACGAAFSVCLSLLSYGGTQMERDLRRKVRDKERQMHEAQKLEAVGTLAGGIAHDFNNLLTGTLAGARLLKREIPDGDKRNEYVDLIVQSTLRASELASRLLTMSRRRAADHMVLRLGDVVERAGLLLRGSLSERVHLEISLPDENVHVLGDASELEQALINLGINAGHAMPEGGTLQIVVRRLERGPKGSSLDDGPCLRVDVIDAGVGIPEEIRDRVFEPFFTTRRAGEGSGLGLAMVFGAVEAHGGFVTVDSEEGEGTTFSVFLREVAGSASGIRARPAGSVVVPGHARILVVDDRDAPLLAAKMTLESAGYDVTIAWSVGDAEAKVEEAEEPFDLILTDAVMPGRGGVDLLESVRARGREMPVVLMSGYREQRDGASERFAAIIEKPFEPARLSWVIRAALEREDDTQEAQSLRNAAPGLRDG